MKSTFIVELLLCLVSLSCACLCIFTDWNDRLFLLLALMLSITVNLWNVLRFRRKKSGEESGK